MQLTKTVEAPVSRRKTSSLKVLHVYTEHRSRGGAEKFAELTMQISRERGLEVDSFTASSERLPQNLLGRMRAGLSAISPRSGLQELSAVLDSFAPDVVHLHDYFPLISPWIAPLCASRGIPVVLYCVHYRLTCPVTTHYTQGEVCARCAGGREYWAVLRNCRGNVAESVSVALHSTITRVFQPLSKYVSKFVAPCEFTREWIIRHLELPEERVETAFPFVDVPSKPVDPVHGEYVAFAGRFVEEKGIRTLLEAARLSGLPVRLSRNELYPVHIDLPATVQQVVTRGRDDLDAFYRGARVLAFPSEWFETFGLVGAEAMSHGVPVVASRLGALTGLIDDEKNGLLFEPRNPRDLADKLTRIWNDAPLCRRLGAAARQKVLSNWTADHYFSRLLEIYEGALAAR